MPLVFKMVADIFVALYTLTTNYLLYRNVI